MGTFVGSEVNVSAGSSVTISICLAVVQFDLQHSILDYPLHEGITTLHLVTMPNGI